jgi:putrescine aminotransferase
MPLSSKTFLNKPLADLSERLARITPGKLQYSFICNSGTEAVECALKCARMATGRTQIVACQGGYHGKTMGALSATGRESFRAPFAPLVPDVAHIPFNDIDAAAGAITDHTAAVIVEPVQGEGGIQVPSADYLPRLRAICDQHGALLIADEVQTGLGRTGRLFAVERYGVEPDIITLAKALGGGVMPIGAVVATPDIWDKVFRANPWIHSSTFGGGEVACAAALAALDVIEEENLVERAEQMGRYFLKRLRDVQGENPDIFVDARGLGLMLGIEFADADIAKIVIGALVHDGVIAAYTLNNPKVVRIEPPLTIGTTEVERVIAALNAGAAQARVILALLDE